MASKRHIRKRSCENKVGHDRLQSAVAHEKSLQEKYRFNYLVYKCKFCGKYHVGRASHKQNIAIKRNNL